MNLNPIEEQELKQNPPGTVPTTPEQFQLRLEIAKKICQFFNESDPTMTEDVRKVYEEYPMWGFYVNGDGSCPRRSYGVCFKKTEDSDENIPALHMITAHLFWINDVMGGVEVSSIRRVDAWSENNQSMIAMCGSPQMFLDPLGFFLPLSQRAL